MRKRGKFTFIPSGHHNSSSHQQLSLATRLDFAFREIEALAGGILS
jgi:hypothetical protein